MQRAPPLVPGVVAVIIIPPPFLAPQALLCHLLAVGRDIESPICESGAVTSHQFYPQRHPLR